MIDLKKVKLVIWDLDETLWSGIISEGNVSIKTEIIDFIKNTTNMGIVHSICSKNDYDVIKKKLQEENIWDYFVFVSADWSAKGNRIKNIINDMSLRNVNVLFVDDDIQNLNEAKFFCSEIMTALPNEIEEYYTVARQADKKDINHKRLEQYKILEKKTSQKKNYSSNEDFLMSCKINVEIKEGCFDEIERIEELVSRSNQLNYTKKRSTREELICLFNDVSIKSGYVKVKDKFGDYGIIGFYAVKNNELIHFVFSCRTLGMRIEQYIYMKLGCPDLEIVGEVVEELNNSYLPPWLNSEGACKQEKLCTESKILFKGPCDMQQIFSFILETDDIETEFTYVGEEGVLVEGHNHTAQMTTALYSGENQKREILSEFSWFDKDMLRTSLSQTKYDFIVLSLLNEGNLGVYRKRAGGGLIALCEAYYDLTDKKNWDAYVEGRIFTSNIKFTKKELEKFSEEYEFVDNSDGVVTLDSIEKIYNIVSGTLVLLLPCERPDENCPYDSYKDRHIIHKNLNDKIREWAKNKDNVVLIPFDKYVHSQNDYTNMINHFVKRVYYDLAQDLIGFFNKDSGKSFATKGRAYLYKQQILNGLRVIKKTLLKKL